MKSRFITVTLACILVGAALFLLLQWKRPPARVTDPPVRTSQDVGLPGNQNVQLPSRVLNPGIPLSPAETKESAKRLSNMWSPATLQYLEQNTGPIQFYGKVVDEKDQPVPDANVAFSETLTSSARTTNSNADGLFAFGGARGRYFGVEVSKPGYYRTKSSRSASDYSPQTQADTKPPDANNPTVFRLRKKGPGADLVSSRYGFTPNFDVAAPRDGTPVLVDLLQRKAGHEGQLEIRQNQPEYLEVKHATAWRFRMELKDGGFVEQNDEFPFEAPESGYQAVLDFDFKTSQTNWTAEIRKKYYIAFGQPRRYGWLTVEVQMGGGGARLEYAINPDGSRNLEPK